MTDDLMVLTIAQKLVTGRIGNIAHGLSMSHHVWSNDFAISYKLITIEDF